MRPSLAADRPQQADAVGERVEEVAQGRAALGAEQRDERGVVAPWLRPPVVCAHRGAGYADGTASGGGDSLD